MKLTPEQHRKAAGRLRELAKHSTIPEEKQHLLDTAGMFESLKGSESGKVSGDADETSRRRRAPERGGA